MADQAPQQFVFYAYTPSKAAAAIMCIVFFATALVQIWMMVRQRTWYFIPFIIGCLCTCLSCSASNSCPLCSSALALPHNSCCWHSATNLHGIQLKQLAISAGSCHRHRLPTIQRTRTLSNPSSSCSVQLSSRRQSTWSLDDSFGSYMASSSR